MSDEQSLTAVCEQFHDAVVDLGKPIAKQLRKALCCRRDVHYRMKYDSGMANDIGRAGTCMDCGYRTEGIDWPKPPPYKPAAVDVMRGNNG